MQKGKERSLLERIKALKDSVCLFLHNFLVPFDNNQAERDVRNVKTKTKVSGCFRTEDGAQNYLDVMSYQSTGMKHGVSVFDALTAAFAGIGVFPLDFLVFHEKDHKVGWLKIKSACNVYVHPAQ